ncbi:MAG: RNA polymerase sigma factor [Planctomycetota bacterium]
MNDERDGGAGPVGPDLLGHLVDRHGAALVLYARQLCDCPEDAVQDALVDLARCREAPRQLLAWLYRAVRYRAMNARRSAGRRRRHESEAARQRPVSITGGPVGDVDAESVAAALESLSGDQREIVVAHVWGGLTFDEIGRVVGLSGSTAHRRFQAALSTIRERLGVPCPRKS